MHLRVTLILICAVACARADVNGEGKILEVGQAAAKLGIRRVSLAGSDSEGLSGLAMDEKGGYVAIPERQRYIVRFHEDGPFFRAEPNRLPLSGVRDGLDTEAIAFVAPGRFAIGTETHHGRREDAILMVEISGDDAHVTDELQLDYGAWGQRAGINHGIEAICFADGALIIGSEVVVSERDRRYAPIARYTLDTKVWSYGKLWLTSKVGKISSLECRSAGAGAIDVIAIERHFGVGRIVRFDVPKAGELRDTDAQLVLDLVPLVEPLPNFEGITWNKQGDIVLLTDNSNVIVDKPTEVYVVPRTALAPQ